MPQTIDNLSVTWNDAGVTFTALKFNVTDTASNASSLLMDLQSGGVSQLSVAKNGNLTIRGTTNLGARIVSATQFRTGGIIIGFDGAGGSALMVTDSTGAAVYGGIGAGGLAVGTQSYISWGNVAAPDTFIYRDASNTVAQRNGANAQTFRLYNTFTNASNYERGFFRWNANVLEIGAEASGSGTQRQLAFPLGTVTVDTPLNITQTWNNAGVTFTGIKFNAAGSSGTNSSASSLLMDLQVGGASQFVVDRRGVLVWPNAPGSGGVTTNSIDAGTNSFAITFKCRNATAALDSSGNLSASSFSCGNDVYLYRDTANTFAQRNGANAQESRVYGSYTSGTNFQRLGIKTVRQSSGALSGATYTTTISIPAYAHLIGVTTRVTTEVTGATSYAVGDGTDVDLWGAAIGVALGSDSDTSNFTAVGAVGAAATSRTITLTANGGNFTGGVVEICAHYIFTEAD